MRILSISDVHGRSVWKRVIEVYKGRFEKIVFLGDYVDSFNLTNIEIMDNLNEIIEFKKANMKMVELLLGNHDNQYIQHNNNSLRCSGRRPEADFDLYEIFNQNKSLFQVAFQYENYIYTHAGIHIGWYTKFKKALSECMIDLEEVIFNNIADELNFAYELNLETLYDCGFHRGGDKQVGGIFWADKNETYNKPLKEFHQIVGHTHINKIKHYTKSNNTSITYTDTQEDLTDYSKDELESYGYLVTI